MTAEQIQSMILSALRPGAKTYVEVAEQIDQAPFRVRAELKSLKRRQLVRDDLQRICRAHEPPVAVHWSLTERGYAFNYSGDQTELL